MDTFFETTDVHHLHANEDHKHLRETVVDLMQRLDYYKGISSTYQKQWTEDTSMLKQQVRSIQDELKKQKADNELVRREFTSLRVENTDLVKQLRSLKKREFELMADCEEYQNVIASKESICAKRAGAEKRMLEAEAMFIQAKQIMKDAKERKDSRSEDRLMIETLKREKQQLHVNYAERCKEFDAVKAIAKQTTKVLEETKKSIAAGENKVQELTTRHDVEITSLTNNCFSLHRVIIRLHEKMLGLMAQLCDGEHDLLLAKMTDAMKIIDAQAQRQELMHPQSLKCERENYKQAMTKRSASLPIPIVNQSNRCPVMSRLNDLGLAPPCYPKWRHVLNKHPFN